MKRWMFSMLLVLSPCTVLAQANALPAAPHLLVKGHAQGRYVPDRFTVKLVVDVIDKSPAVARSKVEAYMQQVFAALDKYHAMAGRTQASTLSVGARTRFVKDQEVFAGTYARRDVEATFDSGENLKRFIDAVDANGELQIDRVTVARSDADKIAASLRKQAIIDSQHSAHDIAQSYGMTIKGVYSVSEVAPATSYGMDSDYSRSVSFVTPPPDPNTVLRVGTIELSQDIYTVYLTKP